jgi:hypothetical protein
VMQPAPARPIHAQRLQGQTRSSELRADHFQLLSLREPDLPFLATARSQPPPAPAAVRVGEASVQVEVDRRAKGAMLVVTARSARTSKPLSGMELTLTDAEGFRTIATNARGRARIDLRSEESRLLIGADVASEIEIRMSARHRD